MGLAQCSRYVSRWGKEVIILYLYISWPFGCFPCAHNFVLIYLLLLPCAHIFELAHLLTVSLFPLCSYVCTCLALDRSFGSQLCTCSFLDRSLMLLSLCFKISWSFPRMHIIVPVHLLTVPPCTRICTWIFLIFVLYSYLLYFYICLCICGFWSFMRFRILCHKNVVLLCCFLFNNSLACLMLVFKYSQFASDIGNMAVNIHIWTAMAR